jgi:hypothetical protein
MVLFTTAVPALAVNYLPTENSPPSQLAYDLTAFYQNNLQCSSTIISPSDVGSDSVDEFRICEFSSLCLGYFRDNNRKYHQIKALLEAERNRWMNGKTGHMAVALQPISYGVETQTGTGEVSAGAEYWQKACQAIRKNTGRALTKAMVSALEVDVKAYEIWNQSADFYLAWIRYLVWKHLKSLPALSDEAMQGQMKRLENVLKVARLKLDLIVLENDLQAELIKAKPSTTSHASGEMTGVVSMINQTNISATASRK